MKKLLLILLIGFASFQAKAQSNPFPDTDSLERFVNTWIRNSAVQAFQNLRLNTAMIGMIRFIDTAGNSHIVSFSRTVDTLRIITSTDTFDVVVSGMNNLPNKLDSILITTASYPDPDSIYQCTSSCVLRGLISKTDTTYLSNRIDNKVDSIHIYTAADPDPDSIYQYIEGDSTLVGLIPKGGGTVNLDTVRTSSTITVTNDAGTGAVLPLVNFSADLAGLMSPGDKNKLDSLGSIIADSLANFEIEATVFNAGDSGIQIGYASNDTFFLKYINCVGCTVATNADSSITITVTGGGSSSLTDTYIGYGDGSNNLTGDANFTWDATNQLVNIQKPINSASPTLTGGSFLTNTTAATLNAQKISPVSWMVGNGWGTTPSASQSVAMGWGTLPVQAATPVGEMRLYQSINGGSITNVLKYESGFNRLSLISSSAGSIYLTSLTTTGFITATGSALNIVGPNGIATNSSSGKMLFYPGTTIQSPSSYGPSGFGIFVNTTLPQISATYDATRQTNFYTDNFGDLTVTPSGGSIVLESDLKINTITDVSVDDSVLCVEDGIVKKIAKADLGFSTGNTIYTGSGSLAGNNTITLGSNDLHININSDGHFHLDYADAATGDIYYQAPITDNVENLAIGDSADVLISNGSIPQWQAGENFVKQYFFTRDADAGASFVNADSIQTVSNANYIIRITAQNEEGGSSVASYIKTASFKNIAGTLTQTGSTQDDYTVTDGAGGGIQFAVSGTKIYIQVNGDVGVTKHWDGWYTVWTKTF